MMMHSGGKPTMFQIMCQTEDISDIYKWHSSLSEDRKDSMNGHLRGQLGASAKIDELHAAGITTETIGSISFKSILDGKTISVLLFKNGKIKISGGFPSELLYCRDVATMNQYIHKVVTSVQTIIKMDIKNTKISCLNGQFQTQKFDNVNHLYIYLKSKECQFHRMKAPDFDIPGRRGAFKLYLHRNRKTHIAIDTKGKSQIFAAISFDELFNMFKML